ncbi:aminoacyl-tRNA hydrolase [Alkaliphilus pronyensis]|uniref:Peptidyl-tRNA hydrolase n=1 Tax=Alkaliphilus pronyensis TaxID=1482732 RepID=A0A6I0F8F0_9FIRM|nr:aminoacyl-tRNA hydrolase [Alkaliphilus pronyensis]KAB3531905.1 aminoacyl-tRNA hydrolase [Alkaliphilus pronyensis]
MYAVVGLGNPGRKYDNTRHNVGFHTIDLLAKRNQIKVNRLKHKALYGDGVIAGEKVLLVKPQTYMNLSGESVLDIVNYYKVPLNKLIVVYDDIDINVGSIRIREKGSAGTHNGMRSIIYLLQKDEFPRIRIGIGKPEFMELSDFVLSLFSKEEIPLINEAIISAAEAVEAAIEKDIPYAMNKFN